LEFTLPLDSFIHVTERGADWADKELYPYAVLEYPVSVLRLYRAIQNELGAAPSCAIGFSMFGLRDWRLRPFSPKSPGYRREHPGFQHQPPFPDRDLSITDLVAQRDDLSAPDDRVALRLVQRIYHGFGYEPRAIPAEFDPKTMLFAPD
jgi:hypothetical protein